MQRKPNINIANKILKWNPTVGLNQGLIETIKYFKDIKMKILITGGAGFIGSAIIRKYIQNTDNIIINYDKLTYAGNLEFLDECVQSKRYFLKKQTYVMMKVFKKCVGDAQARGNYSFSSRVSYVDRSIDGPAEFINTNIIGTYNVLEAARKYWDKLEPKEKNNLNIYMFLRMRFTEIYPRWQNYLLKTTRTSQVHHGPKQ